MKDPIDLNKYKEEKILKEKRKNDLKLFQELTSTPLKDLPDDKMKIYNEIGVVCGFDYKEKHRIVIVLFRDVLYMLNILNGGVFEYIGKVDDIIGDYINKL